MPNTPTQNDPFGATSPVAVNFMTQGQMDGMPKSQYLTPSDYGSFRTQPTPGQSNFEMGSSFFHNLMIRHGDKFHYAFGGYNPAVNALKYKQYAQQQHEDVMGSMKAGALWNIGTTALTWPMGLVPGLAASMLLPDMQEAYNERLYGMRDIQALTMSKIMGGPEVNNKRFGQGFSDSSARRLDKFIRASGISDHMFKEGDWRDMLTMGVEQGMFDYANTSDQYIKVLKKLRKNMELAMEVTGSTDFKELMKDMSRLQKMGFTQDEYHNALRTEKTMAMAAGMTHRDMVDIYGKQGSFIYAQNGLSQAAGSMAGMKNAARVAMMQRQGLIDEEFLSRHGGVTGFAQELTTGNAQQSKSIKDLIMPFMMSKDGQSMKDPQELMQLLSKGTSGINELLSANRKFSDLRGQSVYNANVDKLFSQFSKQQDPEFIASVVAKAVGSMMGFKGKEAMFYGRQMQFGESAEMARKHTEAYYSESNLRLEKQLEKTRREQESAQNVAEYIRDNGPLSKLTRWLKGELNSFTEWGVEKLGLPGSEKNPAQDGNIVDANGNTVQTNTAWSSGGNNNDLTSAPVRVPAGSYSSGGGGGGGNSTITMDANLFDPNGTKRSFIDVGETKRTWIESKAGANFGVLPATYESRNDSNNVTDNKYDHRGNSFGRFQIAGKSTRENFLKMMEANGGEAEAKILRDADFVNSAGDNHPAIAAWRKLVSEKRIQKFEDQYRDYMFNTALKGIKDDKLKQKILSSRTAQEAFLSYALQAPYGTYNIKNSKIAQKHYQTFNRNVKADMSVDDIIKGIMQTRIDTGGSTYRTRFNKNKKDSEWNVTLAMREAEKRGDASFFVPGGIAGNQGGGGGSQGKMDVQAGQIESGGGTRFALKGALGVGEVGEGTTSEASQVSRELAATGVTGNVQNDISASIASQTEHFLKPENQLYYSQDIRSIKKGATDCSGWTATTVINMMKAQNAAAKKLKLPPIWSNKVMDAIKEQCGNGRSRPSIEIIKNLLKIGGQLENLDPNHVRAGTLIYLKKGGSGHILQTYRDPKSGKMMVSELYSAKGKKAVAKTEYSKWHDINKGNETLRGVNLTSMADMGVVNAIAAKTGELAKKPIDDIGMNQQNVNGARPAVNQPRPGMSPADFKDLKASPVPKTPNTDSGVQGIKFDENNRVSPTVQAGIDNAVMEESWATLNNFETHGFHAKGAAGHNEVSSQKSKIAKSRGLANSKDDDLTNRDTSTILNLHRYYDIIGTESSGIIKGKETNDVHEDRRNKFGADATSIIKKIQEIGKGKGFESKLGLEELTIDDIKAATTSKNVRELVKNITSGSIRDIKNTHIKQAKIDIVKQALINKYNDSHINNPLKKDSDEDKEINRIAEEYVNSSTDNKEILNVAFGGNLISDLEKKENGNKEAIKDLWWDGKSQSTTAWERMEELSNKHAENLSNDYSASQEKIDAVKNTVADNYILGSKYSYTPKRREDVEKHYRSLLSNGGIKAQKLPIILEEIYAIKKLESQKKDSMSDSEKSKLNTEIERRKVSVKDYISQFTPKGTNPDKILNSLLDKNRESGGLFYSEGGGKYGVDYTNLANFSKQLGFSESSNEDINFFARNGVDIINTWSNGSNGTIAESMEKRSNEYSAVTGVRRNSEGKYGVVNGIGPLMAMGNANQEYIAAGVLDEFGFSSADFTALNSAIKNKTLTQNDAFKYIKKLDDAKYKAGKLGNASAANYAEGIKNFLYQYGKTNRFEHSDFSTIKEQSKETQERIQNITLEQLAPQNLKLDPNKYRSTPEQKQRESDIEAAKAANPGAASSSSADPLSGSNELKPTLENLNTTLKALNETVKTLNRPDNKSKQP